MNNIIFIVLTLKCNRSTVLATRNQKGYISNDDTQNSHFCRLQLLVESTNQNSLKVPKVVKPTNKKA